MYKIIVLKLKISANGETFRKILKYGFGGASSLLEGCAPLIIYEEESREKAILKYNALVRCALPPAFAEGGFYTVHGAQLVEVLERFGDDQLNIHMAGELNIKDMLADVFSV